MSSSSKRADASSDPRADDQELHQGDWVTCFFSGRDVPRERALKIRLGPGQRVWMDAELTRPG